MRYFCILTAADHSPVLLMVETSNDVIHTEIAFGAGANIPMYFRSPEAEAKVQKDWGLKQWQRDESKMPLTLVSEPGKCRCLQPIPVVQEEKVLSWLASGRPVGYNWEM